MGHQVTKVTVTRDRWNVLAVENPLLMALAVGAASVLVLGFTGARHGEIAALVLGAFAGIALRIINGLGAQPPPED